MTAASATSGRSGSIAKRYLPLAVLAAVQLLIIAVVPSKAPSEQSLATGAGPGAAYGPGQTGGDTGAGGTGDGGTAVAGGGTDGSTSGVGASDAGGAGGAIGGATGGGGGSGGSANAAGGGAAGGAAAGDTTHCKDGRQFDPAIDYYAPPCVAKYGGGNSGASYQGVTKDSITILQYRSKPNAQVDTILKAESAFNSPQEEAAFSKAAEKFINEHYELYGRSVKVVYKQGNCETIPPDEKCLRSEMDGIIRDQKPYFVIWNTSLASAVFDELSALKTPNTGGWHFRDEFANARAPYHWDVQMTYSRMHKHFAEWWCKQMQPNKTTFAGTNAVGQSLNGKPRVLGVIGTDDPENIQSIKTLNGELAKCGARVAHEYHYKQDISTAEQQRKAAVTKMRESPESTDVLCVCDLVAPVFLYEEEAEEQYYPENLVSGSGFMDADASGQSYNGQLGCPVGRNCTYENAFGLSSIDKQEPQGKDLASRIWRAAGNSGNPPGQSTAAMSQLYEYYSQVATLLQAAGPNLTPQNMEAGVARYGARGGGNTGHPKRALGPGNHGWNQDMRVVYWSPKTTSPYNNDAGAYVQIEGDRKDLGQYPNGPFALPGKPR